MWQKIKCFFGFHEFKEVEESKISGGILFYCEHCSKKIVEIKAMMESDLYKMLESGEISELAYLTATQKGYVNQEILELKNDDKVAMQELLDANPRA